MLVLFAVELHVNTAAWIQFVRLRFNYWYNQLQSARRMCKNVFLCSQIFLHLITISFLSKLVRSIWNPNAPAGLWQVSVTVHNHVWDSEPRRVWQAERWILKGCRWCSSWKGKWHRALLSSCSFSPRIISHLSAVKRKVGEKTLTCGF